MSTTERTREYLREMMSLQKKLMTTWLKDGNGNITDWVDEGYGTAYRAIAIACLDRLQKLHAPLDCVSFHQRAVDLWLREDPHRTTLTWLNGKMEDAHIALLREESELVDYFALSPHDLLEKIRAKHKELFPNQPLTYR